MTFSTEHIQTAQLGDFIMLVLDLRLDFGKGARPTLLILFRSVVRRIAFLLKLGVRQELDIATEHDIGTTAGHVGGDCHCTLTACDRDHRGLLRMLLGVEHLVRDLRDIKQGGHDFRGFHGSGAQQHRLAFGMTLGDILDNRLELFPLGTEDQIILILTDHRLVGGDRNHTQLVRAHEFRRLGFSGASHAGELVVHAEVVLQGNGCERLILRLDFDAFLRFDGLMQTLIVAAAGQDAAGMFVNDEHFTVGDHVVTVAQEQFLRLDGVVQIANQGGVARLVQVVDAQIIFNLADARVKDADGLLLLVDLVILVTGQFGHQSGELAVPARDIAFRRSGDDQRGTRLINENGIHLVDDGVMVASLDQLALIPRHVVTQVIETELVVRAVRDIRVVLFATFGGLLIGNDAAHAHAEETEDAAHQLTLVAGKVVVDGDHVNAFAFEGVEVARQSGDQSLAFTGFHFRDIAPMQRRAAHQLDIEVT